MDSQQIFWLKRNWKMVVLATVLVTLIWYFSIAGSGSDREKPTRVDPSHISLDYNIQPLAPKGKTNDKWIVITSINYPTEAIEKFAALPGWRTVVVGDKKTPKDWNYPNVTFISTDKQDSLKYRVTELLPYYSYSRKNIGYLYAVQHGAKIIYESDDDNVPTSGIKYIDEKSSVVSYVHEQDKYAVNVYAHFGKPQVWPRGYPLRAIEPGKAKEPAKTSPSTKLVPIQQGLADHDPDVDAIYRLTQPLSIYFDNSDPISLPKGLMCPWNSQNTLFHNSALWGTLIPITTTFRVCDIWRSYWVQRILWDIGGELLFLPPSVQQIRNAHDYLLDFEDELDLYLKAEDLIKFLRGWSSKKSKLEERILDLGKAMVEQGFWEIGDAILMKAWLEDLIAVGYKFPKPIDS